MRSDVLRGALDAGGIGVWHFDVGAGEAAWSERMAALHGVDVRVGARSTAFGNVMYEDRQGIDEAIASAPSLGAPIVVEYRIEAPGGTRWLESTVSSFTREDGAVVVSAFATDVTARKESDLSTARRRAEIEGLHWVTRSVIGVEGLAGTAAALVEAASDVLGAAFGVLAYAVPGDNGSSLGQAVSGISPEALHPPGRFEWPETVGTERAVAIDDAAGMVVVTDFLGRMGFPAAAVATSRSVLLVPIGRKAHLGAMCFTRDDVAYFTEEDTELASAIASTAAAAIENAQRNEEQRLAARTFQRHLLPDAAAEIPGIDVCTQYHPGRDGFDVGGDWFDVIDLGSRVGLAVGDVCGHGLEAAAHMGQLRCSFRALVQSSTPPEEALDVLNRIALDLSTTATVAYVELDRDTGACAVWLCGHLPPVVASAIDGSSRWIGELGDGGPMLGFIDHVDVEPISTDLAVGEVMLLYTDGLVERRGELIDDGLDRLAAALADSLPVEVLDDRCNALYESLSVRGVDADDVALVAVRRRATDADR